MASRIQQFTTAPEVVGYLLKHLHRMTSSVCRVLLHRVCVCVTSLKRRSLGVLCFIVLFTLLMVLYFNFFFTSESLCDPALQKVLILYEFN